VYGDTWEWDGVTWTERTPPSGPTPRQQHELVYDPQRQRVVLLGGQNGANYVDDVWEWDGTSWAAVAPQQSAPARQFSAAVYEPIRRQLVRFGGQDLAFALHDDTWALGYESPIPTERCVLAAVDGDGDGLAGCADPDCWARCSPQCPPGTACPASAPRCGDGTCDLVEDSFLCPSDCP
jgi:hypothetical protein